MLRADLDGGHDLSLVLHAYNLGPRAMLHARRDGAPLPTETLDHAERILSAYAAAQRRLVTRVGPS